MSTFQIGRLAVRREVVVLAGLFVLGLGIGLGLAHLAVGEPRVSQADYAILVARIYERERNADLAVERLQLAGLPSSPDGVASLAKSYGAQKNSNPRDAESLRNLARDLGRPVAEPGSVSSSARPIWILSFLVFLFVLGLGSLLAFRILGLQLPRVKLPQIGRPHSIAVHRYGGNGRTPSASTPPARQPASQQPPVVLGNSFLVRERGPLQPEPAEVQPEPEAEPAVARSRRTTTMAPPRSQYRFRSSYYFGDEPYDEIHPIADPHAETMVGACGVSAARRLEGAGPDRYWGFTAWVQDYVGEEQQLKAVGLVSKWAYLNFGDEIDEWLRSGQIDELRQVDSRTSVQLETSNLAASLMVQEFEYGEGVPPETYFTRLAAQFDVDVRLPAGGKAIGS